MKHHLKEQHILEHLFGLSAPEEAARIEQHLAECADCRRHAELLRNRFAALETLRETEEASERLIADTLRRVRTDRPARVVRFPAFAWLTGAAAVAALLLAVFLVVPKFGRQPTVELAKLETPAAPAAAPLGGGAAKEPLPAPVEPVLLAGELVATPPPAEPPAGELLADNAPMLGLEMTDREDMLREAESILSDAAGQPPAPAFAMAKDIAAGSRTVAEMDEAPATRAAAPIKEKRATKRIRRPRPAGAPRAAVRLPKGWSYDPTNQVRVMLIPLKSKADGLMAAPVEGFQTRYWQVRVLNDATNAQQVSVTKLFER
ncbi:MAG: zf-HC2 domain-containing protein, partial [Verrucomicrobia bacterium]|nr:zf-HC2 domain-containing protein [Verrucomicrobiota bacterium]